MYEIGNSKVSDYETGKMIKNLGAPNTVVVTEEGSTIFHQGIRYF